MCAHPRRCGADRCCVRYNSRLIGSSPQVRGRSINTRPLRKLRGLIPAGAGQIRCDACWLHSCTAHPRGCGADADHFFQSAGIVGSSPRVRGRLGSTAAGLPARRLIPAGAGQISQTTARRLGGWAHPRGCGADLVEGLRDRQSLLAHPRGCGADGDGCSLSSLLQGSSPRVRGRCG